jgi:hypothetical protein
MQWPSGTVITPPTTSSALPKISQQAAIEDAVGQGFSGASNQQNDPTAYYGLMSNSVIATVTAPAGESVAAGNLDPNKLGAEFSGGQATLMYQNVPTWVVEYTGPAPQPTGSPTSPGGFPPNGSVPSPGVPSVTTTTVAGPTTVTIYIFINADTGAYMFEG